jgi:dTDP-4-amino-4,6-dideoxygalactose transaminase
VATPITPKNTTHAWYKYNLTVRIERLQKHSSVEEIVEALRGHGITCGTGSCPDMSQEMAFSSDPPRRDGSLPEATWLGERNIMLAIDHLFEPEQIRMIGNIVHHTVR